MNEISGPRSKRTLDQISESLTRLNDGFGAALASEARVASPNGPEPLHVLDLAQYQFVHTGVKVERPLAPAAPDHLVPANDVRAARALDATATSPPHREVGVRRSLTTRPFTQLGDAGVHEQIVACAVRVVRLATRAAKYQLRWEWGWERGKFRYLKI